MRALNRSRALLFSGAIILLCMTIIVGMTWALFTDDQHVSNHLQAGDLTVTLKRIGLEKTTLTKDGYLATTVVQKLTDNPVDFTNPKDENVFEIAENEKIVPGTKYVATMKIENLSDVAFGYWIEIVCTDQTNGADLAKQLKVTVNTGSATADFVGTGLTVKGPNNDYVGKLAINAAENFTVTVEFIDSLKDDKDTVVDNNIAQGEKLSFDLVVHAVQLTTAPTP